MKLRIEPGRIVFRLSWRELIQFKKEHILEEKFINYSLNFLYGVYIDRNIERLMLNNEDGLRLIVPEAKLNALDQKQGLFYFKDTLAYGIELDSGRCHKVRR